MRTSGIARASLADVAGNPGVRPAPLPVTLDELRDLLAELEALGVERRGYEIVSPYDRGYWLRALGIAARKEWP